MTVTGNVTFYVVLVISYFLKKYASGLYNFREIKSYLWNVADFPYPTCIWLARWDDPFAIYFIKTFDVKKLESRAVM